MIKKQYLLCAAVSTLALSAASPALAQQAPTDTPLVLRAAVNDNPLEMMGVEAYRGRIDAFYGDLDTMRGRIDAFWGRIDAFWGRIDAFEGDVEAMRGRIDAFWGRIDAFDYNRIDAFNGIQGDWGSLEAYRGRIDAFADTLDYYRGRIDAFYEDAETAWWVNYNIPAEEIEDLYRDIEDEFERVWERNSHLDLENDLFERLEEKHGLNILRERGFDEWDDWDRAAFFMELYDNVLSYSGADVIDHWMYTINWSPDLTQASDRGKNVKIGILDTQLTNKSLVGFKISENNGYFVDGQEHGASVISLIAGAHDGKRTMGIVPDAEIFIHNPFDETGTASWADVRNGIMDLGNDSAQVINISLGVEGSVLNQDWNQEVFGRLDVLKETEKSVFVKAAGNSGVVQTTDVDWTDVVKRANSEDLDPIHERLLIVGALGVDGEIAPWSNTPGEACLTVNGVCKDGYKLKDRFLVAPGEFLLVADSEGHVSRASGTSFAAPLVTGTVALIQDKWTWLKDYPVETADIILQTATDLGEEGVDGVYGHGLLNVEATLEPLDTNDLTLNSGGTDYLLSGTALTTEAQKLFKEDDKKVTAFETIGNTYRDFQVSLSDLNLAGTNTAADREETSATQQAQEVLTETVTTVAKPAKKSWLSRWFGWFDSPADSSVPVVIGGAAGEWRLSLDGYKKPQDQARAEGEIGFTTGMTLSNKATGLRVSAGEGYGALGYTANGLFGDEKSSRLRTGGVNPYLGLASGGGFAAGSVPVTENTALTFSMTQAEDRHEYRDQASGALVEQFRGLEDYRSRAMTMGLSRKLSNRAIVGAEITYLDEETGLFGAQGTGALALNGGAQTLAMTVSGGAELPRGVSLAVSATSASTTGGQGQDSLIGFSNEAIHSTAWQVTLNKLGVFGKQDGLSLSIAQPLHIENGALTLESTQVIDRSTGELGLVTEQLELGGKRRHVGELTYTTPVLDGRGAFSAFGQIQTKSVGDGTISLGGVRFESEF